ncbi:MAG: hypothetical protein HYU02_05845 [Thaumarchaeota archaeon]|nr:hypothetical protein [Nitrososphaerota archaeon]
MKLLDYAWNTATSVSQRDHNSLRLILDEELSYPLLSRDTRGYVIRLPVPRRVKGGFYMLHGLYFDEDETSWTSLWRLFKASLYHTSLHAAYSDFQSYSAWAKEKDLTASTFTVALIEDVKITMEAARRWQGLLSDIAYANYISSLRITNPDDIGNRPLRFATKLLTKVFGVCREAKDTSEEDFIVNNLAKGVTSLVRESINNKQQQSSLLLEAAQGVYTSLSKQGILREIPSLPYTEAHGKCSVFDSRLVEQDGESDNLIQSACHALGLEGTTHILEPAAVTVGEADEFRRETRTTEQSLNALRERYNGLIAPTKLDSVEIPKGDYGMFLRVRAAMSGPIRSIRDRLRQIRNVSDETPGHESGQVDTQAAIQVIASESVRSDIFQREEFVHKDEAWAILIDSSKSISTFAHEVKGIATCLAEVAKDLIPSRNRWGLFGFNNSLQIIKDFQEPYSIECKARIGGLTQQYSTLLPDAMLACYKALSAIPVDNRILMVVSDGYPTGYANIEKTLVSTVEKISKSGVLLMGVGADNPAIRDYFTVSCVLENPYQMMKFFAKSYLELSSMF